MPPTQTQAAQVKSRSPLLHSPPWNSQPAGLCKAVSSWSAAFNNQIGIPPAVFRRIHSDTYMVFREFSMRRGFSENSWQPFDPGKREPLTAFHWCLAKEEKFPAVGLIKSHYFWSQNCYFLIFLFFFIKFHQSRSPRILWWGKHNTLHVKMVTFYAVSILSQLQKQKQNQTVSFSEVEILS